MQLDEMCTTLTTRCSNGACVIQTSGKIPELDQPMEMIRWSNDTDPNLFMPSFNNPVVLVSDLAMWAIVTTHLMVPQACKR